MSDIEKQTDHSNEGGKANPQKDNNMSIIIPDKESLKASNPESTDGIREGSVSLLPVESARLVMVGSKKKKLSNEAKFIHTNSLKNLTTPLSGSRVGKIKNVVYRNRVDKVISQQKTRLASLEETMMFQRQRRLNKVENFKKYQRLLSPNPFVEKQKRKFKRTEDKKKEEEKKFKRNKELQQQNENDEKMLQAKLIRKLREDPNMHLISRIPEHFGEYTESALIESEMMGGFSSKTNEGILLVDESITEPVVFAPLGVKGSEEGVQKSVDLN